MIMGLYKSEVYPYSNGGKSSVAYEKPYKQQSLINEVLTGGIAKQSTKCTLISTEPQYQL